MSDYNLFPEDVCLAVINKLSTPVISVQDMDSKLREITVNLEPLYVYPEPQVFEAVYPSLVIYETNIFPDYSRLVSCGDLLVDNEVLDAENKLVRADYREKPSPAIMLVAIRAYTRFDSQRDIIRKAIYSRFGYPAGGFAVNGFNVSSSFLPETPLLKVPDQELMGNTSQRSRVTQWILRVETRLDLSVRQTVPVVRTVTVT